MQRLFDRIAQEAEALRQLGEELEERLEGIRDEARDELEEVEWRVHHFENDLRKLREDLRAPALRVARSARALALEAAKGCTELRRNLDRN